MLNNSRSRLLSLLLASSAIAGVHALDNGLGLTPAMGWNSWNLYACDISETIVKSIVEALLETGLADAGYKYVNIDDCWQIGRDENNKILVDQDRFPSGMQALSDYIHSKGLKFGIYSSAGTKTCEGRPGSLYLEAIDAQTYADWGVDLLKYDNCANKVQISESANKRRYGAMRDALNATGRPIYYSMCNWGQAASYTWAKDYANSWRMTGDIGDLFDAFDARCPCTGKDCWLVNINGGPNHCSVTNILDKALQITQYSAPGGFNDLDMLEVGNGGMTNVEYRTHFSLWCALKSPLILGNNVANMTKEIHEILGNKELIAINQDPLGLSASLAERFTKPTFLGLSETPIIDIITGPLAGGDKVAVLFNRDTIPHDITLDFAKHFGLPAGSTAALRDLWAHKDLGVISESYTVKQVEPHASVVFRATAITPGTGKPADAAAEPDQAGASEEL
ncbi:glycoside hydrolase superfamily [Entophlyctis helioformis]|nr:glycoside hydrolase superfamily [Entophlyctis helioformis]